MSSQGSGEDGDHEHERQRAFNSHSGTDESPAETRRQFQIRGPRIQTIPWAKAHAMLAYILPVKQREALSITHTQAEAVQPIYTLSSMSEENRSSQSSASAPNGPATAENSSAGVVHSLGAFVRQESHPPVTIVQPQPGNNLSDIYRQHILTHSPIPPLRQIMIRGPQSAVAHTPTIFTHVRDGPRMTSLLQQANCSAGVSQTRQLDPQVLSGIQGRATTQVLGHPFVRVRTPCTINTQQQVAASVPMYGAQNSTHEGNIFTETQIPLTPAIETESLQHYEPGTNATIFNPMQQQQIGCTMQKTFNLPTEHDMALKTGANYNVIQPFTALSGEDRLPTAIYVQHKRVQADQNQNKGPERWLPKQVSAVPTSHHTQHAQRAASNIAPVTQFPVNNVTDSHQVNYPPHAIIPPQQLKTVRKARSRSEFTNPSRTSTEDKSTQVNIELLHQDNFSSQTPNDAEKANTASYNSPASSSRMISTVRDTPQLLQEKSSFSEDVVLMAQAQEIFKQFALDPKNRNILTSATKFIFSNWVPKDDIERQELQRIMDGADYLFTKETEGRSSHEYILQLEDQAETNAGDIPLLTNAGALAEREEGNAQTAIAQEQADPVCKSSDITEESPSPQKLDTSTGNQISTKTDANSAASQPSTSEPQRAWFRSTLGTYYFHASSDMCEEDAHQFTQQTNRTSDTHRVDKNKKVTFIFNPAYINDSSRSSGATNLNNKISFVRGVVSDAWLKAISSQLGEAQTAGSPANMQGENRSIAGPPERGGSLQPRDNSEVTFSCMIDSDLENTPKAVDQQRQITETRRGGQKRPYDLNEATAPAAKKQTVVRLGIKLQHAPSLTKFLPQQIDCGTLSVKQGIADNTLESGALLASTENILSCSNANILECNSLNGDGRILDNYPLRKENENGTTTDDRQETVLDESISVIQKRDYEDEQDDLDKNSVFTQESKNSTEECSNETMAIFQQLREASNNYKETKDNVDESTSDSEETSSSDETETAEDEDEEESSDSSCGTPTPVQQTVKEQDVDFPPDVPQEDEKVSISDEDEEEADTDSDSGLSEDQDEVNVLAHIQEWARTLKELQLIFESIQHRHLVNPSTEPSTSGSTPMTEAQHSQKGHGTNVEHELIVETQHPEGVNASNVHPSGRMGEIHDVIVTDGDVPDETCSEATVTLKHQIMICQERINEGSSVFQVRAIKQEVRDSDVEEESDTLHEKTVNECEPAEGDSSRSEMVFHHSQDKNTDNGADCNIITENKAARGNITSTIEDVTTTDNNEAQLKGESESNSPPEDIDHNYSRSSNISDDVLLISIGEEPSDEGAKI